MDLELYFRVLWRFRWVMVTGLLLASVLAIVSVARVNVIGSPGIEYRQKEQWVSRAMLLITEPKFPEGRSVFEQLVPPASSDAPQDYAPPFANPERFITLANLYGVLATSDPVRQLMLKDGPVNGVIESAPASTVNGSASLPLLSIGGIATTPSQARRLASRAVNAFLLYLETKQAKSGIPKSQRVVLQVIRQPVRVELLRGRPKTLPIVIFLTVLLLTAGIAFVLESLRPRVRQLPAEEVPVRSRRSA